MTSKEREELISRYACELYGEMETYVVFKFVTSVIKERFVDCNDQEIIEIIKEEYPWMLEP
jgi:hypothetical protein